MLRRLKNVFYISDYTLLLHFKNGEQRLFDMEPYLKGTIFEPLKDIDYFKKVRVTREGDTIEWSNGADVAPETLYNHSIEVSRKASAEGR